MSRRVDKLRRLRRLSHLLDNAFLIPIINYRVGLDAIVGLIPGVGDALMLLPSSYIIWEAYRLGTPKRTLLRMVYNVGLEALLGSVPILGDLFDATWKANARNLYLLEGSLGVSGERQFRKPSNRGLLLFLVGILLVLGGTIVLLVYGTVWLFERF